MPTNAGIAEAPMDEPASPGPAGPDPLGAAPRVPDISGLLHSSVAGRTDHLKVTVPGGAYVVPADVVSGIGQGNTMAGARLLQMMFGASAPVRRAQGGAAAPGVPILGAGGEYVVAPSHLARKFGSVTRGHKIMDKWVVSERKAIAKEMMKLPGPVKD